MAATRQAAFRHIRSLVLTYCAVLIATATLPVAAGGTLWQHDPASSGDWLDPSNWNKGLPTSSADAVIRNGGTAEITWGSAEARDLRLGMDSGTSGHLVQTGGALDVTWSLYLASASNTSGSYTLGGSGVLTVTDLHIGNNATSPATFAISGDASAECETAHISFTGPGECLQSGGTFAVAESLEIGRFFGSGAARYRLTEGMLRADELTVYANGQLLRQEGGTSHFTRATVYPNSRWEMRGGQCIIDDLLHLYGGTMDFGGGAAVVTAGNGAWVDLSVGTVAGTGQATLTVGANSLTLVAPGFDPAVTFGSFSTQGLIHEVGTTLVVPGGKGIVLQRDFDEHVECAGTITGSRRFKGGLKVLPGGTVHTTPLSHNPAVTVEDAVSGNWGGSLNAYSLWIGSSGTGVFTHASGDTTFVSVRTGYEFWSNGTLLIQDGTFDAERIYSGYGGTGLISQTGGTVTASDTLYVGAQGAHASGGRGTYELSGGTLTSKHVKVADYGSGVFRHTGGTHTVSADLGVAYPGCIGTYELSGTAELEADDLFVGQGGAGEFKQSGGTCVVHDTCSVGPDDRYEMTGGTFNVGTLVVGEEGPATFSITERDAQVTISEALRIGPEGTIDVTTASLTVLYDGESPFDGIHANVASGCNAGAWDGPGITSSAAAEDAQGLTALGVLDDGEKVVVGYCWAGDANLDGVLDSNDYDKIDTAWVLWTQEGIVPEGGFRWAVGDFTYDNMIDSNDYDLIDRAWVLSEGAPLGGVPAGAGTPVATPEPATLLLLAAGATAALLRRRRPAHQ